MMIRIAVEDTEVFNREISHAGPTFGDLGAVLVAIEKAIMTIGRRHAGKLEGKEFASFEVPLWIRIES